MLSERLVRKRTMSVPVLAKSLNLQQKIICILGIEFMSSVFCVQKMIRMSIITFVCLLPSQLTSFAQEKVAKQSFWQLQKTKSEASLRGLSVFSDEVAWASGTGGTVLKTTDGKTWVDVSIKQASELDFRDIEALSKDRAVVVSAGSPGLHLSDNRWRQNMEKSLRRFARRDIF